MLFLTKQSVLFISLLSLSVAFMWFLPARNQLFAQSAYSVSVADAQAGETLTISWTAPETHLKRSWIGVYTAGTADKKPLDWERISDTDTSGTYTVTLDHAGEYEVRLFEGATYTLVALEAFSLGANPEAGSYSLTAPLTVEAGQQVEIDWTAPVPQPTTRSWIGVYAPGAPDNKPLTWERIPDGTQSGTYRVAMDKPGEYEARLFQGATYDRVAEAGFTASRGGLEGSYSLTEPAPAVTEGFMVVTWTAPSARPQRSWIGVYDSSARDSRPLDWERIPDTGNNGTYSFALDRSGTYEVRLFEGATYEKVATVRFEGAASNTSGSGLTAWKKALTTVFWVGEDESEDNDFIQNRASAWDENWVGTFGGVDDPFDRCGLTPCGFTPNQSPLYVALPYNDLDNNGFRKANASRMPWFDPSMPYYVSQMEGRRVEVSANGRSCIGEVRDVGPFEQNDIEYVLGTRTTSRNTNGIGAGLDISPGMRDCLGVGDISTTQWRFVP